MFKILDGRTEFYQWDLNRKIVVDDAAIKEIHFCNRTGSCSLVRDVYEVNGLYVADVPNILLQDNWDIKVYAFDAAYTKHSTTYNVVPRTKPESYVYTEVEQLRWEQLDERINQIEENGVSDEVVANAVERYMDENGVKVDLTGYATEDYVDTAISGIVHPTPDLTGYATEQYVNDAVKNIDIPEVNLTGYATEQFVTNAIANIDIPDVDLSGYATEDYVDDALAAIGAQGSALIISNPSNISRDVVEEIKSIYSNGLTRPMYINKRPVIGYTATDMKTYKMLEFYTMDTNNGLIRWKTDFTDSSLDLDFGNYRITHASQQYVDNAIAAIEPTPGPAGPAGKDGEDGYTPVKGVDYFDGKDGVDGKDGQDGKDYVLTEADKSEIASLVITVLPSAEEVSV